MHSFEDWKHAIQAAIIGASIARESHDKMSRGEGAPDADDMRRYAEEGKALADLWEESIGIE